MLYSYTLFSGVSVAFMYYVAYNLSIYVLIGDIVLLAALLIVFTLTAASDPGITAVVSFSAKFHSMAALYTPTFFPSFPGIIPKQSDEELSLQQSETKRGSVCSRCNVFRPPKAVHCYDCDACVLELDHHW